MLTGMTSQRPMKSIDQKPKFERSLLTTLNEAPLQCFDEMIP